MIKGKYMIMAAVLGICTVNISGSCVMAAETQTSESDAYPDLGDSEEEQAYREFLEGGEGELYYVHPIKAMSVNMRLADHKSYTLYKIAGDTLKCGITLHKQSLDVQGSDGKYHREYAYSITDKDGNDSEKTLTEAGWDEIRKIIIGGLTL